MNEVLEESILRKINNAARRGEMLAHSLQDLTTRAGFSLAETVRPGAVCADVEFGTEGYALLSYHPAFLILGEDETYGEREELIAGSLAVLNDPAIKIKREYALELVENLLHEGYEGSVGLVTWLNIFPEDTSTEDLKQFVETSGRLLAPSGHMIVSILEDASDRHDVVDVVIAEEVPGLRLSKLVTELSSAGSIFLLGEKLP